MGSYSIDIYCSLGHATQLPMKVRHKGKNQRNSDLNFGRKRRNSIRGKSLVAEM